MCGIVGYVGDEECAPILLDGLKRLEYRGYDSAGVAIFDGRKVEVVRAVGKLRNLEAALRERPLRGTVGVGHTRWATHGRPSEVNAHPHRIGDVALVHNGIIENHMALRARLEEHGAEILSDTDTEIVAHLVDQQLKAGNDLATAVRLALAEVHGAYALAVVSAKEPDRLVVARNASPLVIGLGEGAMLCGSDVPALLPYTRDMIFLEDGEMAVLERDRVTLSTLDGGRWSGRRRASTGRP
jgi:glucosamine--fructose-6-phosphate aminotransferase (isomerizing)